MKSLRELYRVGPGPSSSHTLAPKIACIKFKEAFKACCAYKVDLYGSLSLTGKGHFTDLIIKQCLGDNTIINFYENWNEKHPNGFYISGFDSFNNVIGKWTVFSIGGGAISIKECEEFAQDVYNEKSFDEIKKYCNDNNLSIVEYVTLKDQGIDMYLENILEKMIESVDRGINSSGILPGSLKVEKVAKSLYENAKVVEDSEHRKKLLLMSYAYAASEENASMGIVVTAPTLGACGVLAAMMYYLYKEIKVSKEKLINALKVAGIFGNLIKENATISGAVGGCQAEIGSACVMASAAYAYINDLELNQIECAAEIAMEHHLGLTCDPVEGYVIIPCIERNAVGVLRSFDACLLAKHMTKFKRNRISFDMVVNTMHYTGQKITVELKETSLGGLAKEFNKKECTYLEINNGEKYE
ncbi:MAG: L-serine ammonia-lyase, iron-sulfur-dependent, subunit alpha [Anaerorhabdus sp.]